MNESRFPKVALALTFACGLAAASVWFWWDRGQTPGLPTPASAPSSLSGGPAKAHEATPMRSGGQGVGTMPIAKATTVDVSRSIRMPDGKYLPALNGVLNPPALTWPTGRPYSPVVGTERDTRGDDWYVHADGSKSTMKMIQMNRQGRISVEPVSYVANPQPTLPVLDESRGVGGGKGDAGSKEPGQAPATSREIKR